MQQHRDASAIRSYRVLTELRLSELLEQANSILTLEDIKALIYDDGEDRGSRFGEYVGRLMVIFNSPDSVVDEDAALPVIQDAWNYFPHRSLSGRCPADALSQFS
jgi:hypothetical protein